MVQYSVNLQHLNVYCNGHLLILPLFVDFSPPRELDPGLQEAVSTLIWAAPRLQSEVAELKIVSTCKLTWGHESMCVNVELHTHHLFKMMF